MGQPGRKYSSGSRYRYGFNGKENDKELSGEGNYLDYGSRIYDSRIGRWLSVDPHMNKYPFFSPYIAFNDNPIYYSDEDGNDAIARIVVDKNGKKTMIISANYHYIAGEVSEKVKDLVRKEFVKNGNRNKIDYNGEKISVNFEINFVEHKQGERIPSSNSKTGDNAFLVTTLDPKLGDLSNFNAVFANDMLYKQKVTLSDETESIIPKNVADEELANSIAHGIGHNIGFIHDENGEGLMDRTIGELKIVEEKSSQPLGSRTARWTFFWDHISEKNVQDLVNRVDNMTKEKRDFWKGKETTNKQKKEADHGNKEKLDDSGITTTGN